MHSVLSDISKDFFGDSRDLMLIKSLGDVFTDKKKNIILKHGLEQKSVGFRAQAKSMF